MASPVPSLRMRLLVTIGVSLIVLWGAVAGWMYMDVREKLQTALDDKLAAAALMVAGLVSRLPSLDGPPAEPLDAALEVATQEGLACEVSSLSGGAIAQTLGRTVGSPRLAGSPVGYSTGTFGGERWRTYVLQHGDVRVATADRLDLRAALLRDIALTAAIPFASALVGTLLVLWLAIGRGLQPIEAVRNALAARRPEDELSTRDSGVAVPPELLPLVETVEQLLGRVRATIERERRFTDDAAHELRTPLTAVKTHLQVAALARQRGDAQSGRQSLEQAQRGVLRLQRTLDQLLLLARLDGGADQQTGDTANAAEAARQAAREAMAAHDGDVVVRTGAVTEDAAVAVSEALLVAAIRNLLENALRFAPEGTVVDCEVTDAPGQTVSFTIRDEGPGMTEPECAKAVERFWRRGPASEGSGLGLSIVTAIAAYGGGEVRLRPRPGGGLEARLTLPRASSPRSVGPGPAAPLTWPP